MGRELKVPGHPTPQGSLRALQTPSGAIVTPQAPKVLVYRNDIRNAYGDPDPVAGPVHLHIIFAFKRPNSHFNAKGFLRDDTYKQPAPASHTGKPDIDKLARSVLDALTGYAYHDDSQVAGLGMDKVWDMEPYTWIAIERIEAVTTDGQA